MRYDIADWYWSVVGVAGLVWSSRRSAYVPANDATYRAWLAAGGVATAINSQPDLLSVMTDQWQPGYLAGLGLTIQSAATPALSATYSSSADAIANITGISAGIAAKNRVPGGGTTFQYPDVTGQSHDFTAANFIAFASAVEDYLYNFSQGLGGLVFQVPGASLPAQPVTIA